MMVVEYDGIELDHCPDCAGTWFDGGELALLFSDAPAPDTAAGSAESVGIWIANERLTALPDAKTAEKPRRCPHCRKKMRKVSIGPRRRVMVDVCPDGDGLWFDDQELADLAQNLSTLTGELPRRVVAFLGQSLGREASRQRKEDG
jgi:Zn-finger nucleic acid-binding protein